MRKNLKVLIFILTALLCSSLAGQGSEYHYSHVEFPYIVMVGQIVEITTVSIKVGNTKFETRATNSQVSRLVEEHLSSVDFRSHAFARALSVVEVDGKNMQMGFYLDNLTRVFHDEVQTYMRFLPLLYLFGNNMSRFNLPDDVMKQLKKHSLDFYLQLPEIRQILDNAWFVGVFRIHPDSGKLIYHASNFYEKYEDIQKDEFAQQYRVPGIIRAGMTVTMSSAVVRGRELIQRDKEEEGTFRRYDQKSKRQDGYERKGEHGGVKSGR